MKISVIITLKNDVPLKNDAADFVIKDINKGKLYDFLREMVALSNSGLF